MAVHREGLLVAGRLPGAGVDPPPPGTPPEVFPVGSVWTDGDFQVRAERLTRRDAVPSDGVRRPVWEVMPSSAACTATRTAASSWFDA